MARFDASQLYDDARSKGSQFVALRYRIEWSEGLARLRMFDIADSGRLADGGI
jgi:hypothetical protein